MSIEVRPACEFDDICTIVGPKRPDANVCWCLSYRLSSRENRDLFEEAGFTKAADTDSTLDGFPRVLMRLALSRSG